MSTLTLYNVYCIMTNDADSNGNVDTVKKLHPKI